MSNDFYHDHITHNENEALSVKSYSVRSGEFTNLPDDDDVEDLKKTIKFRVLGLMVTPEYQKCKYIVESLRKAYPDKYEEPDLNPMLDMKWNDFLKNERRLKGGSLWSLKKSVAVYCNDNFMGDDTALSKYLSTMYILPMKNFDEMGSEALKEYFVNLMSAQRRCIYLMIAIDAAIIGTMVFLLYEDLVPQTSRLFLKRCKKLKGGYSDTPIHRIVQGSWVQCGGYRIKEVNMPNENYAVSHDTRGVLSMCNSGHHKNNTSQFLITLENTKWMDTHYVAFGQLIHGDWVLSQIEAVPTHYQQPTQEIRIVRAGEFNMCPPLSPVEGKWRQDLTIFLDDRMINRKYRNYLSATDLALERELNKIGPDEVHREFLDTDLKSHLSLDMLPRNIKEAFDLTGKKSSCLFEVENCLKCGCSHDVGKCAKKSSSGISVETI